MRSEEFWKAIEAAKDMLGSARNTSNKGAKLADLITAAMHTGLAVRLSTVDHTWYSVARDLEEQIRAEARRILK
jgi:hypothetical protein